ncbi:hypothetical protein PG999_014628 [Apiospora kogelbergensis]|uniref:Uncharacterized protein n=1 Tax=Apiospora kogelbergensis TaxID=1337665 RepID=A0AAW0Q5I3_9PEZI
MDNAWYIVVVTLFSICGFCLLYLMCGPFYLAYRRHRRERREQKPWPKPNRGDEMNRHLTSEEDLGGYYRR